MKMTKKESPFISMGLTQPIESIVDAVDAISAIERMLEMYQVMLVSWITGELREIDKATVTTGLEGLFDALRYKTHSLSEYLENSLENG